MIAIANSRLKVSQSDSVSEVNSSSKFNLITIRKGFSNYTAVATIE